MIEGWKIKKIEEFAQTTSGGTPSRTNKSFYTGNILWVKSGELDDNYIIDTEEKITEDAIKNSSAKLFPVGTVLIAMYGATVGKTAILKVPATTNQAVCGIIPNPEECNNEFLRFQLMFKREDFLKQRYGGAQPNISQTIIKTFEILLPPLPEQRKIAYVLSTVQKAIEQQDKLIRTTTELKKALMQKLFTEGLPVTGRGVRFSNPEGSTTRKLRQTEIGLVPESWEVVELGKICEKPQYGFTDSASSSGNAKFLRITDITEFGVDWNKVPYCNCPDFSKYELKDGDIVFARIGATTGKSYLINNPPKSVYASYLIRVRCKKEILPDFLIYYFASEKYWKQIDATKGNNLKGGVNSSILSKLLVPKPGISEQSEIAKIFRSLDNKLAFHQKKKQTLSALFKTLLHELMTGQRRVHEIEFEALNTEINDMSTSL